MGNIVPRVSIEPTSLAFQASVLPLHHIGFPDVITIPHAYLSTQLLASEVSADYYTINAKRQAMYQQAPIC